MKKLISVLLILVLTLSLAACGQQSVVTPDKSTPPENSESATPEPSKSTEPASKQLVVYCPHPLEFIDPIVAEYEAQTGITVEVVAAGTGELLKRIEAEKDNPLGDILWGGSQSTLQPKLDLFEEYRSINEADIFDDCKNTDGRMTRFTNIPSVLMVNTNLIGDIKVEGYEDLLNPALKGKIAHADPSKSSSSFEHLINMLYAMGGGDPEKGWDYVEKLCENLDGKLLSGSSAVYKGVADGEYTVGLTFEEGGAKYVADGAPVKLVYMEEGVISKPDGVVIIKGAKNMDNAKSFIDFVTGKDAQSLISSQLNRRSVRKDVPPADGLKPTNEINLIYDDLDLVTKSKQAWIDKFKEIFTNVQ